MAFRDDRVALRQQVESLKTELAEVRGELERTKQELKEEKKLRRKGKSSRNTLERLFGDKPKDRLTHVVFIVIGLAVAVVGIVVFVIVQLFEPDHAPTEYPGPLPALPGCTRWLGTATGNSTNEVSLRLCIREDQVKGMSQWVSQRAGWSRRSLSGTWDVEAQRMTLQEKAFAAQKTRAGWKFCLVEALKLEQISPTEITGTFRSHECKDQGKIELRRVEGDPPAESATTAPPAPTRPPG
jgi:hypothetical protein